MGFRTGAYATVWESTQMSDSSTKVRMSVSKKNKQTGEYETDFSGFVLFIGTVTAGNALKLKERDRIKILDCDVSTKYVKDKNITYTNFKVFSFENADSQQSPQQNVDENYGNVDSGEMDDELPF